MDKLDPLACLRRLGLPMMLAAVLLTAGGVRLLSDARAQTQVDITKILWCQDGQNGGQTAEQCAQSRELILDNCTSCHSFVPIVKAQKTEAEWDALLASHKAYLTNTSADDLARIRQYLIVHFNPQHPPPALSPELEHLGIDQPA